MTNFKFSDHVFTEMSLGLGQRFVFKTQKRKENGKTPIKSKKLFKF